MTDDKFVRWPVVKWSGPNLVEAPYEEFTVPLMSDEQMKKRLAEIDALTEDER